MLSFDAPPIAWLGGRPSMTWRASGPFKSRYLILHQLSMRSVGGGSESLPHFHASLPTAAAFAKRGPCRPGTPAYRIAAQLSKLLLQPENSFRKDTKVRCKALPDRGQFSILIGL